MTVARDKFNQYDGPWSDFHYHLLAILEEICTPETSPHKTLNEYMADILDIMEKHMPPKVVEDVNGKPQLGLATTDLLLEELETRFHMQRYGELGQNAGTVNESYHAEDVIASLRRTLTRDCLSYRTVDS